MTRLLGLIISGLCLTPVFLGDAHAQPSISSGSTLPSSMWRLSASVGVARYTPSFVGIPRGISEKVVSPSVDVSAGHRLSSRLWLTLSGSVSGSEESRWESESVGGRARIPTPSFWSLLASLRTPLVEGRIVPFVAVGGGFTHFDDVNETIRFEWPAIEENIQVEFRSRTDATLAFDLGAAIPWTPMWQTEFSYRLLSIFSDDRVNTIDHLTVSGVVRF